MAEQFYWIIWDLCAVLMLVTFVGNCARKGLVGTLAGFCGYAVALAGARQVSGPASVYLYNSYVRQYLVQQIETKLMELGISSQLLDFQGLERLVDSLPRWLTLAFTSAGLNPETITIPETGDIASQLTDMIFQVPVLSLLNGLVFFLAFSVLVFVVGKASGMFKGINRIPLIGPVNCALGGIIGVLEWGIFVYIAAMLLKLVIEFTGGSVAGLNYDVVRDTYIVRIFFDFTPIIKV